MSGRRRVPFAIWTTGKITEWLRARAFTPDGADGWSTPAGVTLTDNELLHEVAGDALEDPALTPRERLALGLGMLDLFDDYAAGMYLTMALQQDASPLRAHIDDVWAYCRGALEAPDEREAVAYWLWCDWCEAPVWSTITFDELTRGFRAVSATEVDAGGQRRLRRVLSISGPVPWAAKRQVLTVLVRHAPFHDTVLAALVHGYHDFYGQLDRHGAIRLLDAMPDLAADKRWQRLGAALRAGVTNHYAKPSQW